jgi:hypothetical protein
MDEKLTYQQQLARRLAPFQIALGLPASASKGTSSMRNFSGRVPDYGEQIA